MTLALRAVVAGVALACAGNASAITVDLGSITPPDNKSFSNTVSGAGFSDTWNFLLTDPATAGTSATNVYLTIAGADYNRITNFAGTLSDGSSTWSLTPTVSAIDLPPANTGIVQLLAFGGTLNPGAYSLTFSGNAQGAASYGGNIVVAPVPLPAAAWLFGSALMGMVAIGRRVS